MATFVFDTNALIYLNKEKLSITPKQHHISVISELELLSFSKLTDTDEAHLKQMLELFYSHTINKEIKAQTISLRRRKKLKLPDSIIIATAQILDCALVTNDKQLLNAVPKDTICFDSILFTHL